VAWQLYYTLAYMLDKTLKKQRELSKSILVPFEVASPEQLPGRDFEPMMHF
jgi:hypothetical protein